MSLSSLLQKDENLLRPLNKKKRIPEFEGS